METLVPVEIDDSGQQLWLTRDTLADLRNRAEAGDRSHSRSQTDPDIFGFGASRFEGLRANPGDADLQSRAQGWFAIGARAVATRLMSLNLGVYLYAREADGDLVKKQIYDHELNRLFQRPWPGTTMRGLQYLAGWHLQQTGHAFLRKHRDGLSRVEALEPLLPSQVQPLAAETGGLWGYKVTHTIGRAGSRVEERVPIEDMIRFIMLDPNNLDGAMGVLGPQAQSWNVQNYLEQHLETHFKNDATPRVVMIPGDRAQIPTPEQERAFHRRWRNRHHGRTGTEVGTPVALPSGWDIKELSAHGGSTELDKIGDSYGKKMMMATNTPRSIVGDVVDVNRAAAETNEYIFDSKAVLPYATNIQEALTLLAQEWDPRLACEFDPFVSSDKAHDLAQEKQDLELGVKTINMIRAKRGLPPVAWGELPAMEVSLQPYDGEAREFDNPNDIRERIELKPTTRDDEETHIVGSVADAKADVERTERRWVGRYTATMHKMLRAQRAEFITALQKPGAWASFVAARSQRSYLSDLIEAMVDPEVWRGMFTAQVQPIQSEIFVEEAKRANQQILGADAKFSAVAVETIKVESLYLSRNLPDLITQSTFRNLEKALRVGIDAGENLTQVTKRVQKATGFGRKRARTVARSEVLTAVQSGHMAGWEESGEVKARRWMILGNNTRDSHQAMSNQVRNMGEPFVLAGGNAMQPGDFRLPPKERVNCQCFLQPIVRGVE